MCPCVPPPSIPACLHGLCGFPRSTSGSRRGARATPCGHHSGAGDTHTSYRPLHLSPAHSTAVLPQVSPESPGVPRDPDSGWRDQFWVIQSPHPNSALPNPLRFPSLLSLLASGVMLLNGDIFCPCSAFIPALVWEGKDVWGHQGVTASKGCGCCNHCHCHILPRAPPFLDSGL